MTEPENGQPGATSRRELLRTAAIAGTVAWSLPVIKSAPASAQPRVGSPQPCSSNADCEDFNGCTQNSCVNGTCQNTPTNCDDGDPCTIDNCDPASGCFYIVVC